MDINSLSPKELTTLISEANKRKKVLAKRKPINQVRAAVNRIVRTSGYTMEELFGAKAIGTKRVAKAAGATKKSKAGGKVPPKYRNPANPTETWTGRGKHPRWLAAFVAKGKSPEDFLIKK
ncbi:H-NS histone family protein [Solilutibacter tolerans]|uniref:Nucleoid protein H-NS n=1 Tax=Solilutibacter tolerans TaxID=1604334 RepID=A0A1N6N9D5_9GAMM|nr:H-NS histone family protein [Lysobacter tolerans]SIP88665.1 nucleoid protein H-NS [Lysobacter tolerans]